MTTKKIVPTKAEPNPTGINAKGGYRANAGRKKGSKDNVTIKHLLENIYKQTSGRDYEEILVEDFLQARNQGDKQTVMKYHNLILNKVMNTLTKIEINEPADVIAAKQQAFADALAKLTGVNTTK